MSDTFTDRSRLLTFRRCPQRRLLEYHQDGIGIVPDTVAIPLGTGSAIHLGLQRLLEGATTEEAVQDALREYRAKVAAAGFQDTRTEDQDYTIQEQLALTEVMLRAWALKRLPLFQAQYRIVEVERESAPTELAPGIWLLRRPDGVLENKETGFYEVLSFKTTKAWSYKTERMNVNDDQGISESWAAAQKYGEEKIGPVVMEFLVTGPRKAAARDEEGEPQDALTWDGEEDVSVSTPAASGRLWQWNPFIRAWRDQYNNVSWRYKMPDPRDLSKLVSMGKFCNPHYGKKGAPRYEPRSFAVWEEMPVKEWFDKMVARQVFPEWCDPLEGLFVMRKYSRLPWELKEWQREAAAQESRIARTLHEMETPGVHPLVYKTLMAEVFPKYRSSCQYPTPCPYHRICFEGATDPLTAGYRVRVPNHPQEKGSTQ